MIYTLHGFAGETFQFDFINRPKVNIDLFDLEEISIPAIEAKIDFSKEVILVGYSLGARLAAQIMIRNAQEVTKCLLLAGHMGLRNQQERKERVEIENNFKNKLSELNQSEFTHFWNSLELFSYDQAENIRYDQDLLFKMIDKFALSKQDYLIPSLEAYKEKIHFFYGKKDTKYYKYAQEQLTEFNLYTFEEVGHRVYQYQTVREKIIEVLK